MGYTDIARLFFLKATSEAEHVNILGLLAVQIPLLMISVPSMIQNTRRF
jgi:hypothetical protein